MEIDRTTEPEDENGGMGAGAPDGQGLEDQGNVRLYEGYMGVVRRNREDADRTMRQRTVAAAAALMNIYENPKNGGYSDRSLSDSLSGAFGTPVFGMQRLDGLKGDNEALNGSVALIVPQRGQDGSVTTGVSAMLSPAQQLKILQDARLGDRTAPLQRELWGGLAKRFTPEQLEQQGLRDPDALFRPQDATSKGGTTLEGGTAARLGTSILPQERRGISSFSADGKGGFSRTYAGPETGMQNVREDFGTRAPGDGGTWRTLRSGYIAEHGADGTVYENAQTGETRFVPNGSAAPQGGALDAGGAQAPVAGRGGARTARAGAAKPAAQGTAGAKPATEKYSRELLEDINAEIEGLSKNANPTEQDRADLALLRRRKMSLLTGRDLDAEEAAAKANAPDEVRRRQREAVEARFGSFFGGDGNLKGSGFSSFGGKQYLYFRNDDGTTVRAEPGQTVSLNGFPVRWNGGGAGRDSFEIVEPGAAKAEAGEGKAKDGKAAGGNTASASSAPDEKAVSAARMRRREQNAKDAARMEARKDMDGAEQAKAEERAKASKEIRARNAQKAETEKEKRLKEEKFRAYLADLRRQHGKEDIPEEDAYRIFENDWWWKFNERMRRNLEDMSNYEKLHGKSKTYIPPSGKL